MASSIELRILSGSRAGEIETFDQPRIAVGRHPSNDLRFDPFKDLDVSTRHGDIRWLEDDGAYVLRDNNSTNGTFVNGARLEAGDEHVLVDGDTISFGANGPKVEVHLAGASIERIADAPTPELDDVVAASHESDERQAPIESRSVAPEPEAPVQPSAERGLEPSLPAAPVSGASGAASSAGQPNAARQEPRAQEPPAQPRGPRQARPQPPRMDAMRRPTRERVALEVAKETRGLKIAVGIAIVVLGALGFGAYWMGHSEARAADAKLQALMASYDSSSKQLLAHVQALNDTGLARRLGERKDSLERAARNARGGDAAAAQESLQQNHEATRAFGEMDLPAVHDANDNAVVLIRTEFGRGKTGLEASGFSVSPRGFIVTNRHVVAEGTARASKISVKFANTATWMPAYLVRMPSDTSVDLALIQLDDPRKSPTVTAIAPRVDVPVGGPVASLGFPDGSDLPMDGTNAKTTLTLGTVSKLTNDVVQIDSYASHGSSGSPVFDGHGHVVGAIFGGAPGSNGRIVYAVPANRIAELVKGGK